MRDARNRRTARAAAVTLGALVALGAPATALAHSAAACDRPTAAVAVKRHEQRKPVKVVRFSDGSLAKVYKLGGDRFRAEIFVKGEKIGSMGHKRTTLNHNGLAYGFNARTGKIWAWDAQSGKAVSSKVVSTSGKGGKAPHKPQPKKKAGKVTQPNRNSTQGKRNVFQEIVTLDDGSRAAIFKTADGSYIAKLYLPDGSLIQTMGKNNTVFEHNGFVYTFHPYKGSIWGEQKADDTAPPAPALQDAPTTTPEPRDDTPSVPADKPDAQDEGQSGQDSAVATTPVG